MKKNQPQNKHLLWIGVIVLEIALIVLFLIPKATQNTQYRTDIANHEKKANEINEQINELESSLKNKTLEFQELSADETKNENQILPDVLEIEKLSKTIEIYSLINNSFEISSLSFGDVSQDKEMNVSYIPVNMVFYSSEKTARAFIQYLQNNKLPLELQGFEVSLKKFIEENPLPLANIQNINFENNSNLEIQTDSKKVTIDVNFYGKPVPEKKDKK